MTINSDKQQQKELNIFQKMWRAIFGDLQRTFIIGLVPVVTYFGYTQFNDIFYGVFFGTIVVVFVLGLLTNGELFGDNKSMAYVFNGIFLLIVGLWYMTSAVETEKDTLYLKPYITEIKANKDKTNFVINMKLPFQSGIESSLYHSKFQPLFADKEHFKEFTITAVKTCYKYRFKSVDCDTRMFIKHNSTAESVYEFRLTESIYPKKFKLEIEQEQEDM